MSSAALPQDSLLPQPAGGLAPGALAALVVHAGLIAALTLSIDWRSHQPEVVAAELWAAVPQSAAPPPAPVVPAPVAPAVTPPVAQPVPTPPVAQAPPQPDPDIAIERDRRLKAEKQKADEELKRAEIERKRKADEKKAEDKKANDKKAEDKKLEAERKKQEAAEAARVAEEKAQDARTERIRQDTLRRMMSQAGTTPGTSGTAGTSTGTSTQNAAPSADYLAKLRRMLREQINFNGTVPGNAAAEVSVSTASGGTIISRSISKSSGLKEWDDAVLRALDKLGTMPRENNGRVPPRFTLVFRQSD